MLPLAELSTDILVLVLSYLPPADKAALSRVCKWLQRFAEPMLYADVRLNTRDPATNALQLHSLLLKFLAAPAIASHVKHFQTGSWRALNGNSQTLVISQLPNLVELGIGYDIASDIGALGQMFRRVLCSKKVPYGLSKFQHLKRVNLYVHMTRRDYPSYSRGVKHQLSHFLPYFYLPSIEDLRIIMPHDQENFPWPATPPYTQSLTSLSLKRSSASDVLLARILAVTPNLKCLEYGFICEDRPDRGPTSLCAEGLGKALAHVKATLERLTISVHFLRSFNYPTEAFPSRYGIKGRISLHDYKSLVMLEVPIAMLIGYRPTYQTRLAGQLPPRIRQLYLTEDTTHRASRWKSKVVLELLRGHLSQYREQTADLETLVLKLDRDEKLLDDFRSFCEGVNLTPKFI